MQSYPFLIRAYRDADHAACRSCIVELQEAERQLDPRLRPGEEMADDYMRHVLDRCRKFDGALLVAEGSNGICGLVLILARFPFESPDDLSGDYALVADLIVTGTSRNRGVGSALLEAAERFARSRGASELRVSVLARNTAARELYLRHGFGGYLETMRKRL